jgi:hypothetical protein
MISQQFARMHSTTALGFGTPIAGAFLAHYAIGLFHLAVKPGANLGWLYLQHAGQGLGQARA